MLHVSVYCSQAPHVDGRVSADQNVGGWTVATTDILGMPKGDATLRLDCTKPKEGETLLYRSKTDVLHYGY